MSYPAPAELRTVAGGGQRVGTRRYLADWRGLLLGQAVIARQMIRKVLEGRLMMPEEDEDGRRYRFTGHAGIGRLVLATPIAKNMVTPGGFARMWERQVRVGLAVA